MVPPRPLSDDHGFTLIEVLIAGTLLLVGALATLALLDNGATATVSSRQRDVANAVAQEMVERPAGGRYTVARNDMTDIDTDAAPAIRGPADRLRRAMDPTGDAQSTTIVPATTTAAPTQTQRWSLVRQNTRYEVTYSACTTSDTYQGVMVQGPYDCTTASPTGTGSSPTAPAAAPCVVALLGAGGQASTSTGPLTLRLSILGSLGLEVCLGAVSSKLADAVCSLLGATPSLSQITGQLLGSQGLLSQLLGGLVQTGATGELCPAGQVEQGLLGARGGIASTTRVSVSVAWTDGHGRRQTIRQSTVLRRPAT